jgi:hypothetical protein
MAPTPTGMAPVFAGWNVWDVYQADSPDENILGTLWHAGITEDQLLKLWVENQVEDNASGANVSDPLNPSPEHFRGDNVQIIASPGTLARAAVREDSIPELTGAQQLGTKDSTARLRTVRFYNRGSATVMPWPHDQNFLVDAVFQPDAKNPLTNAPAPTTFGGAAKDAAAAIEHGLETLAWVVGGAATLFLLFKLRSSK